MTSRYEEIIEGTDVARHPIILSSRTVAMLTLFQMPRDSFADLWTRDFLREIDSPRAAARQLVALLKMDSCGAFWMALVPEIIAELAEHDGKYGTTWASETVAKLNESAAHK